MAQTPIPLTDLSTPREIKAPNKGLLRHLHASHLRSPTFTSNIVPNRFTSNLGMDIGDGGFDADIDDNGPNGENEELVIVVDVNSLFNKENDIFCFLLVLLAML